MMRIWRAIRDQRSLVIGRSAIRTMTGLRTTRQWRSPRHLSMMAVAEHSVKGNNPSVAPKKFNQSSVDLIDVLRNGESDQFLEVFLCNLDHVARWDLFTMRKFVQVLEMRLDVRRDIARIERIYEALSNVSFNSHLDWKPVFLQIVFQIVKKYHSLQYTSKLKASFLQMVSEVDPGSKLAMDAITAQDQNNMKFYNQASEKLVFKVFKDNEGNIDLARTPSFWIACSAYRQLDLLEKKSPSINISPSKISLSTYDCIIRAYTDCHQLEKAQAWFEQFLEQQNYSLSDRSFKKVYISMARGFALSGQVESAEDIITNFLPRAGILPDADIYNEAILHSLLLQRNLDPFFDIYNRMESDPLIPKPNWRTKCIFATALMYGNEPKKLLEIAREILASAPSDIDTLLQSVMLYFTCRSEGIQSGLDLYKKLESIKSTKFPGFWGAVASINMYLERGQSSDALTIFLAMLENHDTSTPYDVFRSFRIILDHKNLDLDTLALLFEGIKSIPSFLAEGIRSMESIVKRGLKIRPAEPSSPEIQPLDSILKIIIEKSQKDSQNDSYLYPSTKALLYMAKDANISPSPDLCMSIYSILLRKNQRENARSWAKDLLRIGVKDPRVNVNFTEKIIADASASIIKLCTRNSAQKANDVYDELVAENLMPNFAALLYLVRTNFAKGEMDRGFQLMIDALDSTSLATAKVQIYESALEGLAQSGDVITGLAIVQQMTDLLNVTPRNSVIVDIVRRLALKLKITDEQLEAVEGLLTYLTDPIPLVFLIPAKIRLYNQAGRVEDAVNFLKEAAMKDVRLPSDFLKEISEIFYTSSNSKGIMEVIKVYKKQYGSLGIFGILKKGLNLHYNVTKDVVKLKEMGKLMDSFQELDLECYEVLLSGLCKLDSNMDTAKYYYSKAEKERMDVGSRLPFVMLKGYARQKDLSSMDHIRDIFAKMMENRTFMRGAILEELILIMIRDRGSPAHAAFVRRLAEQMLGCRSTVRLENMLLKAYLDSGAIMSAKQIFKELRPTSSAGDASCKPRRNSETYRIMIEGLRQLGKDDLAKEYSKLMLKDSSAKT